MKPIIDPIKKRSGYKNVWEYFKEHKYAILAILFVFSLAVLSLINGITQDDRVSYYVSIGFTIVVGLLFYRAHLIVKRTQK